VRVQSQGTGARHTVALEVGGQRLRLTAHGNEKHLEGLAALVNQRVEEMQKSAKGAPASTTLALVALDLADEIIACRRKVEDAQRDAARAVAEADDRARAAEQSARVAIAEALAEIDRAIAADDALVADALAASESA
jgi:cell division protein ZapA (FtsZ GTPase activity inhibitor)